MKGILARWGSFGAVALAVVVIASAMALTLVRVVVAPAGQAAAEPSPASPVASASPAPQPSSAASLPVGVERTDGLTYYTVQPFDIGRREGTLAYLAARFGTTVIQLVKWNNIKDPDVIHPGERFRVR